jgi:diaminohydroxyphosphoribosylaminopyrimidine deaminase/5-amino-6-(5-phosphoribosylamino)uracil reductase
MVHQLRARVDAIAVGIGTARADDPQLTARGVPIRRIARRVVVDPRLRLPEECQLLRSLEAGGPPVMLAYDECIAGSDTRRVRNLHDRGVELLALPRDPGTKHLPMKAMLHHLAKAHAATNVLVEGGAGLIGDLLAGDLIDEAMVFIAPLLMGDAKATPAARGLSVDAIAEAKQLRLHNIRRLGEDVLLHYRRP